MSYQSNRPDAIEYCECWTRDGLQSIQTQVPTEHKLEMLHGMIDVGIPEMEVTSFSHPKLLPQFADAVDVLKGLRRDHDSRFRVLMPNMKGWERFEECVKEGYGAHKIILMISSSEDHNMKNFRADHAEAMADHAAIMKRAHAIGVEIVGCVGTVYGCAIKGDVPQSDVDKLTHFYHEEGAQLLMLGDTTGQANPVQVERILSHLFQKFPDTEFLAHFHDTRGTGVANSMTAVNMGIKWVDGSLGAIGGQPAVGAALYHLGYKGNTCTEDLIAMLDECGIKTGIDIDKLLQLGRRAEEVVGFPMRSNVIHAGRVDHDPSAAEKGSGPGVGASVETTVK
ncbi:MAG: hydroxymethylglutaryl-CoA lyase [Planctomycetes bacterium]|nr:hydroxymethylglutaryl-CoA lyase [Planctomycetota bacterium]